MPPALPLTYGESRARFLRATSSRSLPVERHVLTVRGGDGQELSIDVARLGEAHPTRALVVLSGVHGVEGFIGSALQTDLVDRIAGRRLPPGVGILIIHGVNPWGMSWWRRQNEHNVDLNRNWARDRLEPSPSPDYDELHPLLCPDTDDLPDVDTFVATMWDHVDRLGIDRVRQAVTGGQYSRPDGLHFGGDRLEESTAIVAEVAAPFLAGCELSCAIDLHTGHGPFGECTLLSDQPPGSPQDLWLHRHFPQLRIEATVENPAATTGPKTGQIGAGLGELSPGRHHCTSVEFGTVDEVEQLVAAYHEQWMHRRGGPDHPEFEAVRWRYRCCFTPEDPAWVEASFRTGRDVLDAAIAAVGEA